MNVAGGAAAGFQLSAVLYRHGIRLLCGLSAGIWLPCQYRAGRVQVSTDIASYLSFVMALFMAFGVSFEVPVAIVLLCWMGITSPEDLRKNARMCWLVHSLSGCC